MTADDAMNAVMAEVKRAMAKFPTWPDDPIHAAGVLGEEAGEVAKAVLQAVYEPHKSTPADVRVEVVQTAAMCIRFLLSMERYKWAPCPQHAQARLQWVCDRCGPIGDVTPNASERPGDSEPCINDCGGVATVRQ